MQQLNGKTGGSSSECLFRHHAAWSLDFSQSPIRQGHAEPQSQVTSSILDSNLQRQAEWCHCQYSWQRLIHEVKLESDAPWPKCSYLTARQATHFTGSTYVAFLDWLRCHSFSWMTKRFVEECDTWPDVLPLLGLLHKTFNWCSKPKRNRLYLKATSWLSSVKV